MSRNEKSTGGNRSEDTLSNAARDKRQLQETSWPRKQRGRVACAFITITEIPKLMTTLVNSK